MWSEPEGWMPVSVRTPKVLKRKRGYRKGKIHIRYASENPKSQKSKSQKNLNWYWQAFKVLWVHKVDLPIFAPFLPFLRLRFFWDLEFWDLEFAAAASIHSRN